MLWMKDTFKMPTSSQVQKNNESGPLSTHKCCESECTGRKSLVTLIFLRTLTKGVLMFFPTWRRTFFSPGLYILYKQVLDSMMHWNKMKQLSSEGQSALHFHEFLWYAPFIVKFRILPASDVNQHSRLFTLSYIKITRRQILYVYLHV